MRIFCSLSPRRFAAAEDAHKISFIRVQKKEIAHKFHIVLYLSFACKKEIAHKFSLTTNNLSGKIIHMNKGVHSVHLMVF